MAQLLAGSIIALGLLIFAALIFLASRERKTAVSSATISTSEPHITPTQSEPISVPVPQQPTMKEVVVADNVLPISKPEKSMLLVHEGEQSSLWWQEQFHSLTAQLQYLREHAKDVERQIAILSEIAALATELEMLQKKRDISSEGKISLFPLQVHRQPTDMSYLTDKRPVVRKYTIEAMS